MYPLISLHGFTFSEIIPAGAEFLSGLQAEPWYLYLRSITKAAAIVSEYRLHSLCASILSENSIYAQIFVYRGEDRNLNGIFTSRHGKRFPGGKS
jgi:hypothetical protein